MPGDHDDDKQSCVRQLMDDGHDESSAHAICEESVKAKNDDVDDPLAVKAVAYKLVTGEWGDLHPAEKTKSGREHLLESYRERVEADSEKAITRDDMVDEEDEDDTTEKSDDEVRMPHTVKFKMKSSRGILPLFKAENGEMVIWGPASVEVVDKEGDVIRADALKDALPQLLRRQRLSLEHSDQLVGEILENFETDEEITVQIDDKEFTRKDFPTDVLELDDMEPSLFVAGKLWDDTRQARQAQKDIENGDLDSYSISGESLVATTKYEEGDVVNDIKELDLSAVTLCEEGMNQKAKFGVVSKAKGDARTDEGHKVEKAQESASNGSRGSAGIHSNGTIQIVKHMTEDDTEASEEEASEKAEPDEGAPDESETQVLSLEDVRAEFKGVVSEALPDDELATKADVMSKEDVEAIVEEKSLSEDDVQSIATKAAEDVLAREDEEEMADEEDEVPEEFSDEEPDEEKGDYEEDYEDEEEKVDEVDADEIEDPDDDGEDEVDVVEDDEDEEFKGYSHEELQAALPEDLYEAVREYLGEDDGDLTEEVEFAEEKTDGDDEEGLTEDDIEKMLDERFGDEMILDSPQGPTQEVQKSWEQDDDPATDEVVGPAAQQLYD